MAVTHKDFIRKSAIFFRDKTAVVSGERSLTYAQVDERANRLANALYDLGLKPRDRVATLMPNCLEFAEIMFGVIKGGLPQVHLNPRLSPSDLVFQIDETEASAVIVDHHYAEVIDGIRDQLPKVKHVICFDGQYRDMLDYEKVIAAADTKEPPIELDPSDLGEIHYSGGTTGRPKGIMLPYANKMGVTRNILMDKLTDLNRQDHFVALQPLYHGAGWYVIPAFMRGTTQYIVSTFTGEIAVDAIEKHRITVVKTIPTVLLRMLDVPDLKQRDLSSLRTIVYGAEPMPVERLKQAIEIFGPMFAQIYGQMEAAASISFLQKEDHYFNDDPKPSPIRSVGRPASYINIKIIDDEGNSLPAGEMGEVALTGDHIMMGYLNRPEETAKKLRDGWIYTGDIGYMDEDGFVYLTGGRKSEMIISGGLNIYPAEVEQVLAGHPAVAHAAVIGVRDPQWGEAVKACIVLKQGQSATEEELIDFCKDRMPSYKKPRSVDFFTQLPQTGAGKTAYAELRKLYQK